MFSNTLSASSNKESMKTELCLLLSIFSWLVLRAKSIKKGVSFVGNFHLLLNFNPFNLLLKWTFCQTFNTLNILLMHYRIWYFDIDNVFHHFTSKHFNTFAITYFILIWERIIFLQIHQRQQIKKQKIAQVSTNTIMYVHVVTPLYTIVI